MGHVRMLGDTIGERTSRSRSARVAGRRRLHSPGVDESRVVGVDRAIRGRGCAGGQRHRRTEGRRTAGGHRRGRCALRYGSGAAGRERAMGRVSPCSWRRHAPSKDEALHTTLRYVAFVNEESPYDFTEHIGSRVHARRCPPAWRPRSRGRFPSKPWDTTRQPAGPSATRSRSASSIPTAGISWQWWRMFARERSCSSSFVTSWRRAVSPWKASPRSNRSPVSAGPIIGLFGRKATRPSCSQDTAPFRYPEYHSSGDHSDRITPKEFAGAADGIIRAIRGLTAAPQEGP